MPKKSAEEAQTQHEAIQRMGLSIYASKEAQAISKEHQKERSFRKCPACKRVNRSYEITD